MWSTKMFPMQRGGGRQLLTYTLWCYECRDEVAAYKGKTGRNAYSRGVEHLDYLEANDEDKSVLWLHSLHHDQSRRDVKYKSSLGWSCWPLGGCRSQ